MFERILKRMRERVRLREYVMTRHGEEEMDEDDLTVFDVEKASSSAVISSNAKKSRPRLNGSL